LEELWNALQERRAFALLCAYPLHYFGGATGAAQLRRVCETHADVIPAESYTALPTADARMVTIVALQQKAERLEAEIAARTLVEARLAERMRVASLSGEIATALTLGANLREGLQRCVTALVAHLDAAVAGIWILNEPAQLLELQASAGQSAHRDGSPSRVPVGRRTVGRIAQERQPYLTNQVIGDPRVVDQDWAHREGMVAFAGYPLVVGDQVVGVLSLFARQALTEATVEALETAASGIALGIERARAVAALADEHRLTETLYRISSAIAAQLDLSAVVQTVTDEATRVIGAAFGAFFYNVVDERGEAYQLYTLSGAPREAFARFPMPRNTAMFGPIFRGEGPVRSDDVRTDPRYGHTAPYHGLPPGHLPVRSYLGVSVVSRSGEVLGGLFFGHPTPGVFSARHEGIVVAIAAHAAVAIDNARLYSQAQSAREAAQRALQVRDEFLSSISHDLRTPLTTVTGITQLLLRQAGRGPTLDSSRAIPSLQQIDHAATRMATMIDELLDLTRLESGRPLDLNRVTADALALIQQVVEQHQRGTGLHRLHLDADLAELTVCWDSARIERVVSNLLSNAIKYSPEGGTITVRLHTEERSGQVWLGLEVADEGLGIPAADLSFIFERFHRADNVRGRIKGIGVGLAGAKQIIEQHGGTIAVASEEGHGTRVTVWLPCTPEADAAP
jgi:signal transduction histidine kinase